SLRRGQGAFPTDGDDRLDVVALHHLADAIRPAVALERVGTGGSENCSALLADALHLMATERQQVFFDDPAPAALEADELLAVELVALEHGPSDDRVESGCVSTTGQDSDSHTTILVEAESQARPAPGMGGFRPVVSVLSGALNSRLRAHGAPIHPGDTYD